MTKGRISVSLLGFHLRAGVQGGVLLMLCGACCPEVKPGADSAGAGDGAITGTARLSLVQSRVFDDHSCVTDCHEATNAAADLRLTSGKSHANLVNVASKQVSSELRVVPGDASRSYLVKKLEGTGSVGDQMPRLAPPLDQAVIDLVRSWISRGAPDD